jgi:malonyl CoA-acyl carrier protein transacylase
VQVGAAGQHGGWRTAGLFPGQGSQHSALGAWVGAARPDLRDAACERFGTDAFAHCAERGAYTQVAVYCASLAAWEELDADVDVLAGHSLGELAALAAAGALDHHAGLELVARRGELTETAARGGMLACLGRDAHEAAACLVERTGMRVANDNSPRQVVLSGTESQVRTALEAGELLGMELVRLPVSAPFHSELMRPAVAAWRRELEAVAWREPALPVLSSVSGAVMTDPVADLAGALTRPVRWQDTVRALAAGGVTQWVEVGPGRVLGGLTRRIVPGARVAPTDPAEAVRV